MLKEAALKSGLLFARCGHPAQAIVLSLKACQLKDFVSAL
jgi:hypothetical protein